MLMRLAITIRTALLALFRISGNVRESYENSLAEHWAVAAAIRKRAPEEAEEAMRHLLRGTMRDLEPAFNPKRPKRGGKS
jgi:DNA-binding GntR family transcriptional regulator